MFNFSSGGGGAGGGSSAQTLANADYFSKARLALVANNCRLPTNFATVGNWVFNCWTKHRSGPTGFSKGIYASFVNGIIGTNQESNGFYNFNLRCGIYINGKFTQGVWATTANIDSLLAKEWGKDTAFFDVLIPPNTDFYITNRRVAEDLGAAGTYNVITNTSGRTARADGIISSVLTSQDFTMGVGIGYGAKALAPSVSTAGVVTNVLVDPNNAGFNYSGGLLYDVYFGAAASTSVNFPGSLVEGTSSFSGYVNTGGGQATSFNVGVGTGSAGINQNAPPTVYIGGTGTPGTGFGTNTATYGPFCLFGTPDSDSLSILNVGDSITAGYGSVDGFGDIYGNHGLYEQAEQNKAGVMNFAVSGESATGFTSIHVRMIAALQYLADKGLRLDEVIIALGGNDFNSNNNSNVIAATQNAIQGCIGLIKNVFPDAAYITTTVIPATTGTFDTLAGQSALLVGGSSANFGAAGRVLEYNTAIRNGTGIGALQDGFLDPARVIADPTTIWKWRVAGDFYLKSVTATTFTDDGIHPNTQTGQPYLVNNMDMSQVLNPVTLRKVARVRESNLAQPFEGGEFQRRLLASGSAVSLTTATPANITSITLSAGNWLLGGVIAFVTSSATVTIFKASTSRNSNIHGLFDQTTASIHDFITTTGTEVRPLPWVEVKVPIGSTVTYYLVGEAAFSTGSVTAYGKIMAKAM